MANMTDGPSLPIVVAEPYSREASLADFEVNTCSQWIALQLRSKYAIKVPGWSAGRPACDAGRGDLGGLAVVTHDSAQYRYVDGQLQRSKKPQQIRGLNQNHKHAIKEIFKSAALGATLRPGPFQDFLQASWLEG
jgi:hypothetical protein